MADDRHICPICEVNVHGICGVEDDDRGITYRTTCFLCHEFLQKPGANPDPYPDYAKGKKNTDAAAAASSSSGAKRATETSLQYGSSDDENEVHVLSTVAAASCGSNVNSTNNKVSRSSVSAAPRSKKPQSRPKKRGKNDALLALQAEFIVFDYKCKCQIW